MYNASMATMTSKDKEAIQEFDNTWSVDAYRKVVTTLLERRFEKVSASLLNRIWKLSEKQLQDMAVAVIDFRQIRDASAWITAQKK